MKDGLIQQVGSPLDVYNFPVNQFVAGFIGSPVMNFIPCKVLSRDGRLFVDADAFRLPVPEGRTSLYQSLAGSEAIFGIRPTDIYDRLHCPEPIKENTIQAVVEVIEPLGSETHLNVTAGNHHLIACVDVQTPARVHQTVDLALDLDKMHLFEKDPPNLRVRTESQET
jgi:multiple sugar transport system ATP-binding protein